MKHDTSSLQNQTLFQIAWPIFFEIALHMGTGIIATFMLGHYSDLATAGVGVANQVLMIFVLVFEVTAVGSSILISQAIGADDIKRSRRLARSSFGINFWFGILIGGFLFLFGENIIGTFGLTGDTFEYAVTFIQIVGASLCLESVAMVLSAILRSHGFMKEALVVTIMMNVICVLGNSLSLYGIFGMPILGVAGVAWTIVIARIFLVVALLTFMVTKVKLVLSIKDVFTIKKDNAMDIFTIGVPSAAESLSYHVSQLVITNFIAIMGDASLAARVYLMNISMLCYLFAVAVAHGSQLLVGRYIGAGRFEDVYNRGMKSFKLAVASSFIVSLFIASLGEHFLRFFTSDPEILAISIPILWAIVFIEPARGGNIVLIGCLKSVSDVRFPVIIGLISMWGLAALFSYIFGIHFGFGLLGVWIAQGMDEWFRFIFAYWRWNRRPWVKKHGARFESSIEVQ